jgi:hypothetical protein
VEQLGHGHTEDDGYLDQGPERQVLLVSLDAQPSYRGIPYEFEW